MWRHYYTGTQGLIFVVDCADRDRIDEARQELHRIINDREMRDAIILIFANKQDLPDGISFYFINSNFAYIYIIYLNKKRLNVLNFKKVYLFDGLTREIQDDWWVHRKHYILINIKHTLPYPVW